MRAARLTTEDLLYAAEAARPGSVVDLSLAPGESLAACTPALHRCKTRPTTHIAEDDLAIALVPPRGRGLRVVLQESGWGSLAPLDVILPRDVAVALIKPPAGRLSLRRHPKLDLIVSRENDHE